MQSFKKYAIYLLALSFIAKLYAVQTVYRADTEAPVTVFQNGISAQEPINGNFNLLVYLQGTSTRQGNAGLIATFASDFDFNLFAVPMFYLYTIRADAHFYDANLSLRLCQEHPVTPYAEIECRDLLANRLLQSQNIFVTQNYIPTSNIVGATQYIYNATTRQYQVGAYTVNPNYQALPTESNPYAYPITSRDANYLFERIGIVLAEPLPNHTNPINRGLPIGVCPIRRHASVKLFTNNYLKTDESFGCKYLQFEVYPIIVVLFSN